MGEPDNSRMQVVVRNNYSIVYETQGKNQKALVEIDKCLDLAIQYDYGYIVVPLLLAKAYNITMLIKDSKLGDAYIQKVKKLLQQAYYIALARGESKIVPIVKEFWKRNFDNIDE